jgi:DNA-binding PadR family transcriptional regulator
MPPETLAEFEFLVMLAVLRLGGDEAYAVSIADEIRTRTGRPARRASVYSALQRLEEKGFVDSSMSEPRPERGGKARRVVEPTPDGRRAVAATRDAFRSMWQGVEMAEEAG